MIVGITIITVSILVNQITKETFSKNKTRETIYSTNLPPPLYLPKNISNLDRVLNSNNINAFNRMSVSDGVEGGQSLTVGSEYKIAKKDDSDKFLLLNLATVLRDEENPDLPENSAELVASDQFKPSLK